MAKSMSAESMAAESMAADVRMSESMAAESMAAESLGPESRDPFFQANGDATDRSDRAPLYQTDLPRDGLHADVAQLCDSYYPHNYHKSPSTARIGPHERERLFRTPPATVTAPFVENPHSPRLQPDPFSGMQRPRDRMLPREMPMPPHIDGLMCATLSALALLTMVVILCIMRRFHHYHHHHHHQRGRSLQWNASSSRDSPSSHSGALTWEAPHEEPHEEPQEADRDDAEEAAVETVEEEPYTQVPDEQLVRRETASLNKTCLVCTELPATCVGVPMPPHRKCGHIVLCVPCARNMARATGEQKPILKCPICRVALSQFLECF